jgi:hypothetical protein
VADDSGLFLKKSPVPVFGSQIGQAEDPHFVFFQVFLQNLNRVIFLRTTALSPSLCIFPADSQEFTTGNTVQVFVGNCPVGKMEIRGKKPAALVEVGGDFVIVLV